MTIPPYFSKQPLLSPSRSETKITSNQKYIPRLALIITIISVTLLAIIASIAIALNVINIGMGIALLAVAGTIITGIIINKIIQLVQKTPPQKNISPPQKPTSPASVLLPGSDDCSEVRSDRNINNSDKQHLQQPTQTVAKENLFIPITPSDNLFNTLEQSSLSEINDLFETPEHQVIFEQKSDNTIQHLHTLIRKYQKILNERSEKNTPLHPQETTFRNLRHQLIKDMRDLQKLIFKEKLILESIRSKFEEKEQRQENNTHLSQKNKKFVGKKEWTTDTSLYFLEKLQTKESLLEKKLLLLEKLKELIG